MKQRPRIYYTEEQKALMWDRWLEFAWTRLNQRLASAVFIEMRWNWEGICYLGWVNGYRRLSENG